MLSRLPHCFLCTEDPTLVRAVTAHIKYLAHIQRVENSEDVAMALKQFDPSLLLLDLRTDVAREHLAELIQDHPDAILIAFGTPRSVPAQNAEAMGVYAVIDLAFERHQLQTLVRHALDHLRLLEQNRLLKLQTTQIATQPTAPSVWPPLPTASELFAQAFRFFDNPDMMFDTMAHGIIAGAKVSRVVLFAYNDDTDTYRYRAGANGLRNTLDAVIQADAPFVQHLKLNAHVICRTRLSSFPDAGESLFLKHALDLMGAEIIVPMHAHHSMIGWVALGHRITGMPFSQQDIENLVPLIDQVAVALSNQLLFNRTLVQKALAESIFHAMPVGVIAVGSQGLIHWINRTGADLFCAEPKHVIRRPASDLSSYLGDLLNRCASGELTSETVEWDKSPSGLPLQITLCRMMTSSQCVGALAVLRDISQERKLRQQEAELERQRFWTGLAAAMSHEIRNPLVAISTFAQLLPERYADTEFRDEFSKLVSLEVERLNGIVNQINDFAEHATPSLVTISIEPILQEAANLVINDFPGFLDSIEITSTSQIPTIRGDATALTQCFEYILRNAVEATLDNPSPQIQVTVTVLPQREHGQSILITITDNGLGIPESIRNDVFSPFCTTKPRGIGVGLSVARRTLVEHGGTIGIPASNTGGCVEVTLPSESSAEH